jgi:hypothetical protein
VNVGNVVDLERRPARERLRGLLGDTVDELTDRQCGRVLGAVFATAQREIERAHEHDDQLPLDAA